MNKQSIRYVFLGAIVLLSLIGAAIDIYTTSNGPWGYTDPVEYISVARSLDQGQGLAYYEGNGKLTPETLHPPLYSLVLSAIGLLGVNLVAASRWLNVAAFVASIFIAGWIFWRYSPVPAMGIIASALMCAFPYMLVFFASSYSEPLFVLSILAGGWALLAYLSHPRPWLFILSALVVSTIPGTRYAGLGMVAAAGLTVFLFSPGKLWPRLGKAALFSLIAGLPVAAWLGWVYFSSAHTVGGRLADFQAQGLLAQFQDFRGIFMDTVWKWVPFQSKGHLLSYRLRFILMGLVAAGLIGLSILAGRRFRRGREKGEPAPGMPIFTFFGLSALIFVAVLILTYLFTRPTIDIDNRMLLPLFVSLVMTIFGALALWQAAWFWGRLQIFQVIPWALAVVCVYWYYPQARQQVKLYQPSQGITMYKWGHSALIEAVRALPADQPVISNDWELTMLWTGRPIRGLWTTFPVDPPIQKTVYGTNPNDTLQTLFCEQGAALVIYNDFSGQFKALGGEWLTESWKVLFKGLPVYGQYADGTIYLCH